MPKQPETHPWPAGERRSCELVIFDLDGTLVDSFGLFISIYNSLVGRYRLKPLSLDEAERLRQSSPCEIMARVGLPYRKLPWIARDFMSLMGQRRQETALFGGIGRVLHELHGRGVRLAVVSSNSLENCRRMLGDDIGGLMDWIEGGASLFGKHRRIRRVLAILGVQPGRAIYVGDQLPDADAARAAGVAFGAVSWGYGAPEALARQRPDITFARVEDQGLLAPRGP